MTASNRERMCPHENSIRELGPQGLHVGDLLNEFHGVLTGCSAARAHGSALNIVVIEDNHDLREMLSELLLDEGHKVSAAAEGTRGLELIVMAKPDLALVDIGLPGLDGYGVVEAVRRQLGKAVRMVALSGYGQPEDKARALRAGFDAHLTKPIDLDSLHAAMTAT